MGITFGVSHHPKLRGLCPGNGACCVGTWNTDCGGATCPKLKNRCRAQGGAWIPKNYGRYPYTCEMRRGR